MNVASVPTHCHSWTHFTNSLVLTCMHDIRTHIFKAKLNIYLTSRSGAASLHGVMIIQTTEVALMFFANDIGWEAPSFATKESASLRANRGASQPKKAKGLRNTCRRSRRSCACWHVSIILRVAKWRWEIFNRLFVSVETNCRLKISWRHLVVPGVTHCYLGSASVEPLIEVYGWKDF